MKGQLKVGTKYLIGIGTLILLLIFLSCLPRYELERGGEYDKCAFEFTLYGEDYLVIMDGVSIENTYNGILVVGTNLLNEQEFKIYVDELNRFARNVKTNCDYFN